MCALEFNIQPRRKSPRCVIYFINGIGDILLNLPAIRALYYCFQGDLALVCRAGPTKDLYKETGIPRLIAVDAEVREVYVFDANEAAAELRSCEKFISLAPYQSKSIDELMGILRPAESIGFFPSFHKHVPLNHSIHSADLAFAVPTLLNPHLKLEAYGYPVQFRARDRLVAKQIVGELPSGSRALVLHADTLKHKMWPTDRWFALLNSFLNCHRDFVVLVVGKHDLYLDSGAHASRIISCCGLSLITCMCLTAAAALFVGIDSCMLHVADNARVPSVGLFGPTRAQEFGFRFGPNITLQAADGNMGSLRVETVRAALEEILRKPQQHTFWS